MGQDEGCRRPSDQDRNRFLVPLSRSDLGVVGEKLVFSARLSAVAPKRRTDGSIKHAISNGRLCIPRIILTPESRLKEELLIRFRSKRVGKEGSLEKHRINPKFHYGFFEGCVGRQRCSLNREKKWWKGFIFDPSTAFVTLYLIGSGRGGSADAGKYYRSEDQRIINLKTWATIATEPKYLLILTPDDWYHPASSRVR
ncbi:hypothetical protein PLEOSDRAFT_169743 [Pleurotus ostreatus PC15]|uniref:Uncharacterized protein n=1 Tax=Pleurotus ostreatus (strain PC15) TaxID=1137138 RepID=A0A067NQI0_PLEO1|nr:hypothetical protein PLEOSDRAFT_169743 [Pleurotus ostreatus PC15]